MVQSGEKGMIANTIAPEDGLKNTVGSHLSLTLAVVVVIQIFGFKTTMFCICYRTVHSLGR